ncbi:hypothetical protein MY5147_009349 [Beauveria neobassiana]
MDSVLVDFEEAIRMLNGEDQKQVREGGLLMAYEVTTAKSYPDLEHFKININLDWDKLNEYYTKLNETPVYYASAILNPVSRWEYFENTWTDVAQRPRLQKAKEMVRELWEEGYKSVPSLQVAEDDLSLRKLKVMISAKTSLDAEFDEYDQFLSSPDLKA